MGEEGVTARAEKAGVNDLDHKIRPPGRQPSVRGYMVCRRTMTYSDGIWIRGLACWLYVCVEYEW